MDYKDKTKSKYLQFDGNYENFIKGYHTKKVSVFKNKRR